MLINKENKDYKDYKINSFNIRSIIILSTFAILILYLSNTFLFENLKHAWADSVIANITVGDRPNGVAYDPDSGEIYVSNWGSSTVSVINTTTHQVEGNPISVGYVPAGIAYDPVHKNMYVANVDDNTISVIATSNHTVVATIPITIPSDSESFSSSPYNIAYDSATGEMYVSVENEEFQISTVSVINTNNNSVVVTIPVGSIAPLPLGIAYDSSNEKIYVANYRSLA